MGKMFTATLGLAEVSPKIATLSLIVPDQRIDSLVTNSYPRQRHHKTANLLWTPLFSKPVSYGIDQARELLCPLPGRAASLIAVTLRLCGFISLGTRITSQLTAHGTTVNAKLLSTLTLAQSYIPMGKNLISLCLGQLSVSHTLLHFGR